MCAPTFILRTWNQSLPTFPDIIIIIIIFQIATFKFPRFKINQTLSLDLRGYVLAPTVCTISIDLSL